MGLWGILECPACGGDLAVSSDGATTLMGYGTTFDSDGRAHDHDPNWTSRSGRCAQKHYFIVKTHRPCPSGCGYGEDYEILAAAGAPRGMTNPPLEDL